MSRHRYVRNLDLDGEYLVQAVMDISLTHPAEMASDSEEEESGMTGEEQGKSSRFPSREPCRPDIQVLMFPAQMATSMPIARALLKDCKPPISDESIADSLWHYWFDVEKAVGWLRKDWEKKGECCLYPNHSLPTRGIGHDSIRSTKVGMRAAG